MKVITSCMNCFGKCACPVWMRQLTIDEKIAHYGPGIIHPDCPLQDAPRNYSLIDLNKAGAEGFRKGEEIANERWRERMLSNEKIEMYALGKILGADNATAVEEMQIWMEGAKWMRDYLKSEAK